MQVFWSKKLKKKKSAKGMPVAGKSRQAGEASLFLRLTVAEAPVNHLQDSIGPQQYLGDTRLPPELPKCYRTCTHSKIPSELVSRKGSTLLLVSLDALPSQAATVAEVPIKIRISKGEKER